jgi:hypothetical protein
MGAARSGRADECAGFVALGRSDRWSVEVKLLNFPVVFRDEKVNADALVTTFSLLQYFFNTKNTLKVFCR